MYETIFLAVVDDGHFYWHICGEMEELDFFN
jgi:hypothetical protein